ncbi:MAG: hypothetical protein U0836_04770 [Pirellulales bacterium]
MVKARQSKASAGESIVTVDRRRTERRTNEKRAASASAAPSPTVERRPLERRAKVNRRRQIDPTTCERDYTNEEVEFMQALDQYKRKSGRMFPTCSELLEVLRGLGYQKVGQVPLEEVLADQAAE